MKSRNQALIYFGMALSTSIALIPGSVQAGTYAVDSTTPLPLSVHFGNLNNTATLNAATTGTHSITDPSSANNNTVEVTNRTGNFVATINTADYALSIGRDGSDANSRTVLVGQNSVTRGVTVQNSGTLQVTGSLNGAVLVAAGGTLMGTGSVGSVDSSGTLAPGASIGTLTVNGNLNLRSGNTLQVEISPRAADKLAVSGSASLGGTLQVLPEVGSYTVGTSYDVITAQSVSGQFNTLATSNPDRLGNLVVGVVYEGDKVRLVLMERQVASATQQQESVKESAPAVTRATTQALVVTTAARISSIINPLRIGAFAPSFMRSTTPSPGLPSPGGSIPAPGAPGGGAAGTGPNGKRDKQSGSFTGLAAGDPSSGWAMWSDASVTLLDDSTVGAKWDATSKSGMIGFDYSLDEGWVAGMVLGIDQTTVSLHSVGGEQGAFAGTATLYTGYKFNDYLFSTAMVGYGRARNDIRQIVAGSLVKGEYDSNRYFANVSGTVSDNINDWLRLSGTLGYTHMIESFHPYTGDDGSHVELPVLRLGTFRLSTQADVAITDSIIPYVLVGVEKDVLNSKGKSNREGVIVGGGMNAKIDDNFTLGFVTNANIGRGEERQIQLGVNVRYAW